METGYPNYKTITQIINDGDWYEEKNQISPATLRMFQNKLDGEAPLPGICVVLTAILSIRTWLDLTDQESDEQVTILHENDFCSVPLNPANESIERKPNFLTYYTSLHQIVAPIGQGQEPFANRFMVCVHKGQFKSNIQEVIPFVILDVAMAEAVQLNWFVNKSFLSEDRVKSLAETHDRLLNWLSKEDWQQPIPDLLSKEQRAVRDKVNQTAAMIEPQLVHQAFFQHARKEPQSVALFWEDNQSYSMTYGALSGHALKLSRVLVEKGAEQGSRAAIILPKGPLQILAVLGVLGSGGLYIPIGVEQPYARQEKIVKKAGVRFIVTNTATLLNFPHLRDLAQEQNCYHQPG